MSGLVSWGSPADSLMDLISRGEEKKSSKTLRNVPFCTRKHWAAISIFFSEVFLPLTHKKWKHLSLYPLATSDWEIPLNSRHLLSLCFSGDERFFPLDPSLRRVREGRFKRWKCLSSNAYFFGGERDGGSEVIHPENLWRSRKALDECSDEEQADVDRCLSHPGLITFASDSVSYHGKLKTAQPWQQNTAHESAEQQ